MVYISWTVPRTWVANEIATAANINTHLRDNMKAVAGVDKAACRAYNAGNISVANTTNQGLGMDTDRFDTQGIHSTSVNTDRFTIPTGWGGQYIMGVSAQFASNTTGSRLLRIGINGSGLFLTCASSVALDAGIGQTQLSCSTLFALAAGDYVNSFAFQNSGGSLNVEAAPNSSPEMWVIWQGTG